MHINQCCQHKIIILCSYVCHWHHFRWEKPYYLKANVQFENLSCTLLANFLFSVIWLPFSPMIQSNLNFKIKYSYKMPNIEKTVYCNVRYFFPEFIIWEVVLIIKKQGFFKFLFCLNKYSTNSFDKTIQKLVSFILFWPHAKILLTG